MKRRLGKTSYSPAFPSIDDPMEGRGFLDDWRMSEKYLHPNITEADSEYKMKMRIRGMDKDDMKITINKHILTVKGETKDVKEFKTKEFTHREVDIHTFERQFKLPKNIIEEEMHADIIEDILTVSIPRRHHTA